MKKLLLGIFGIIGIVVGAFIIWNVVIPVIASFFGIFTGIPALF